MDGDDLVRLALLGVAFLLSAFFSGSEAAFLSIQRGRIASMVRSKAKGADRVARIAGRPEKLLPAVLTGNNLMNVMAASLATSIAASYLSPGLAIIVATAAVTILLLVFAEMLPKTIASRRAEKTAILTVRPLELAQLLFFPLVWVLERLSSTVARLVGAGEPRVTEEEIRSLIDVAETEGAMESSEAEMLERVFHFGDRRVQEVMTPRTEISWVEKGATLEEVLAAYATHTHTRFPVFENNQDTVVGILSIKDLLGEMTQGSVKPADVATNVLRPPYFVPETKLVAPLLNEMRDTGRQMAICVDQHGSVAGLVTLQRLLEVIVGPVGEEGKPAGKEYAPIGPGWFDVRGGMSVQEANQNLNLGLPYGDYQTVAGFVLKQLGRIPSEGEVLQYNGMRLEVKEMRRLKIERIEVSWDESEVAEPVASSD